MFCSYKLGRIFIYVCAIYPRHTVSVQCMQSTYEEDNIQNISSNRQTQKTFHTKSYCTNCNTMILICMQRIAKGTEYKEARYKPIQQNTEMPEGNGSFLNQERMPSFQNMTAKAKSTRIAGLVGKYYFLHSRWHTKYVKSYISLFAIYALV